MGHEEADTVIVSRLLIYSSLQKPDHDILTLPHLAVYKLCVHNTCHPQSELSVET